MRVAVVSLEMTPIDNQVQYRRSMYGIKSGSNQSLLI